jgi:beta-lactamase class D
MRLLEALRARPGIETHFVATKAAVRTLALENPDTYTLYGKTGWTRMDEKQLRWLVGSVEKGTDVFFYALNLESADAAIPMREARESILRYALTRLGILEASD